MSPQIQQHPQISPRPVRVWLAMLLVLLIAALPGPQAGGQPLGTWLDAPAKALTSLTGRELIARKDAVAARPVAATDDTPGLTPPARGPGIALVVVEPAAGDARFHPLAPRARAPPPDLTA